MPSPPRGAVPLADAVALLSRHLRGDAPGFLLVVTGAGVSAASGLATFRGPEPEAVWRQDDVRIATREYLEADPAGHWRWFLDRFSGVLEARPNAGHRALASIETWQAARGGGFLLLTQNVDTLHEQAGSRRLVKVHGTADRLRCSRVGCALGSPEGSIPREEVDLRPFLAAPRRENVPACPLCSSPLRPHALLFDEFYDEHRDYRFDETQRAARSADRVVTVGTSHSVGVTHLVLREALGRGAPVVSVDPHAAGAPAGVVHLPLPAEELLPRCAAHLAGGPASRAVRAEG